MISCLLARTARGTLSSPRTGSSIYSPINRIDVVIVVIDSVVSEDLGLNGFDEPE